MRFRVKQLLFWGGALATIGGSIVLTQHLWREQGLRSVQAVNSQRVQLVTSALYAEINRQDHLPSLLSMDSDVRNSLATTPDAGRLEQLSRKLQRISSEADTRALYVLDPRGVVIASDDWQSPTTRLGRSDADRRYFRNAVERGKSAGLELDPEAGQVRYYLAEAIKDRALLGVVVVRIDFDRLEGAWERARERVAVTDRRGVVFLTSDPVYRYRLMNAGDRAIRRIEGAPDYYRGSDAPPISWEPQERLHHGTIVRAVQPGDGSSYLYEAMTLPEYGWTVHRFADLTSVHDDQRDGAIIGAAISSLILSLLLYVIQRHRAYVAARDAGVQLKSEVTERTRELQDANASLRNEVDERRRTEARLRSTQNELVQAGKLAALGQMSATLAHEINQPLAALQTFIASAKVFMKRGDTPQVAKNLDLITDLADRMASLTAHLKTFARKSEPGHRELVDVSRAVEGALFLVQSRINQTKIKIEKHIEPNLIVNGHAVQLEQVVVNLLLNSLDVVAGRPHPTIRIAARSLGDTVSIAVADNGPGIPTDLIQRIFDPFVTTKPIGKGLGLGLSISYGIVQDFHGHIFATNRPDGGAEVTVELPRVIQERVPAVQVSNV